MLSDDPKKPVKKLYDQNFAAVHRIAMLVPEFSIVWSKLSKTKSKLLPQLPQYVHDLISQEAWRKTWCGKRFYHIKTMIVF